MEPQIRAPSPKGEPSQPDDGPSPSDTVVVEIGPKSYQVSKRLLTQHSDYFRDMFRNDWAEQQDQKASLPDVEINTWEIFLAWIETKNLPITKWEFLEAIAYPRDDFPHFGPLYMDHYEIREVVEMYSVKMIELGSYLGANEMVKKLHNWFVDRTIKAEKRATYGTVVLAFNVLPEEHILRTFLVKAQLHYHDPVEDEEKAEAVMKQRLPADFLTALSSHATVLGIDSLLIYDGTPPLARSRFHIHGDKADWQLCDCTAQQPHRRKLKPATW